MSESISGKTVLVTGASTGIGAAIARDLAAGNTIFVHYNRSRDAAEAVAADVKAAGGTAHLVKGDVGRESDCAALVAEVTSKTDVLDVLINNAGGLVERRSLADGPDWKLVDEVFRVNTYSAFYLTSALLPLLTAADDPSVINITSVAIRTGAPTAIAYAAAKAAVDTFTRGAARELAPKVRVNSVAPGVIITPFHDKYTPPERIKAFVDATPLQTTGTPQQIAHAIRFLIENRFVTGESIEVNGGMFMR